MGGNEVFVHPTSTVHPKAKLDTGVWVGPYSFVGEKVVLHRGTRLEANVFIDGLTEVGPDCLFWPFSSIGTPPQDVSYKGEETLVRIGKGNTFREGITIHRATVKGGGVTEIGDRNYFMAYTHIAHDCRVGQETVFINGATLGGHVEVGDYVMISAFSAAHQFCRIGKHAFVGGYSVVTHDVPPFCRVAGSRPIYLFGLNVVGLRRRGFSNERIKALKEIVKILFYSDLNTSQALQRIEGECPPSPDRTEIVDFIRSSKRGIIKKVTDKWELESG